MIQRRGSGLLARSKSAGVFDFSNHDGFGWTRSRGTPGDEIEVSPGFRARSFQRGSSGRSRGDRDGGGGSSVTGIDKGSPGREITGEKLISAKTPSFYGCASPVVPHLPRKQSGLAPIALAPSSGTPPSTTSPEEKSQDTVHDASGHGDNANTPGTTGHDHANASSIPAQRWSPERGAPRANGGPPATGVEPEYSTENTWQRQLSPKRARGGSEPFVQVAGLGSNRAQPQFTERYLAVTRGEDNTASARIGRMLMALPLSKLKIVIGTLSHTDTIWNR